MRLGGLPLELDVPARHRGVIEAGAAQNRDPAFLVELHRSRRTSTEQHTHDASLFFERGDLCLELQEPRGQHLGRGSALEQQLDSLQRNPDASVARDGFESLDVGLRVPARSLVGALCRREQAHAVVVEQRRAREAEAPREPSDRENGPLSRPSQGHATCTLPRSSCSAPSASFASNRGCAASNASNSRAGVSRMHVSSNTR